MIDGFRFSRRVFFERSGTAGIGLAVGMTLLPDWLCAEQSPPDESALIRRIADAEVRAGVEAAIAQNLLPAASERPYPGHFTITADGNAYGGDATWPGLDSWQMAGAYLLLGRTRMVLDYFEFVRASQRKDGNIPFAVFPGDTRPDGGCLRGLKHPDDVFTYTPPEREGLPASSRQTRTWIGLFEHWQSLGYPLSVLGPICYILTAAEIFEATGSVAWLRERLGSLEAAAKYVLSRKTADGLISVLWPLLLKEPGFWRGDMPTQTVTRPFSYERWEINESPPCPAPPLNDVAAMGRVWYLEATACRRMRASERLVESARKVCRAAKPDGYWRERYHPKPDGSVSPAGAQKYCEYAAVLVRVVFANQDIFCP